MVDPFADLIRRAVAGEPVAKDADGRPAVAIAKLTERQQRAAARMASANVPPTNPAEPHPNPES